MAGASPVFAAVEEAFRRMGWQARQVEGREVLEADFEVFHTRVRLHCQAFAELNAVHVVASASGKVPESRMGVVAEMLMRTNHDLTIGGFELDYDTGAVHFRAANVFPPGRFDHQVIASLVHSALAEMDRLTPFLTLVLGMGVPELSRLNMKLFLQREDLLPPVPEHPNDP
jgi:hypothetical protein